MKRRKRIIDVGPDFQEACRAFADFQESVSQPRPGDKLKANIIEEAGELSAEMARWIGKGPVFSMDRVAVAVADVLLHINVLLEAADEDLTERVVLHMQRRRHQLQSHMESVKSAEASKENQA